MVGGWEWGCWWGVGVVRRTRLFQDRLALGLREPMSAAESNGKSSSSHVFTFGQMGGMSEKGQPRHQNALSPTEFLRGPGRSFVLDLGLVEQTTFSAGPGWSILYNSSSLPGA